MPDRLSLREDRLPLLAFGLLLALYFLTRWASLGVLPMFLDEAVHLQWAERLYNEGRMMRPAGSGRLLAVMAYGLALLFEDRLGVARFIASLVGATTLLLTMLLSHRLFGARAGVVAGFLYLVSPFALTYDRLALSDGFLGASMTGLMLATLALAQAPHLRSARVAVAGLVALAIASKVSALLFLVTVPLGALALAKDRRPAVRSAAMAAMIGLFFASPIVWFFLTKGGEISAQHLVDPMTSDWLKGSTLRDMREWVDAYFTVSAALFAAASLFILRDRRALWLGVSVALPFVLFAVFSVPWSARYVLPTLPPFLILISGGIEALAARYGPSRGRALTLALSAAVSLQGFPFDRDLIFEPARASFPRDDRIQLVTGWPSGYGVRELAARLKHEAIDGPFTAYVDTGGTRTVPTSLAILSGPDPRIRLVEGDFGSADLRASMTLDLKTKRVFAILGPRPVDLDFVSLLQGARAERVEAYERPGGEWVATLFRLRSLPEPPPTGKKTGFPSPTD